MDVDRIVTVLVLLLVVSLAALVLRQQRDLATLAGAVGRLHADLQPDDDGVAA